jgi:hypothetical protein
MTNPFQSRHLSKGCPNLIQIGIFPVLAVLGKGIVRPFPFQPLSQRLQSVDHPGQPRMAAKKDQSPFLIVHHPFIIDKGCFLGHHLPEHRHVVGLFLDHMDKQKENIPF